MSRKRKLSATVEDIKSSVDNEDDESPYYFDDQYVFDEADGSHTENNHSVDTAESTVTQPTTDDDMNPYYAMGEVPSDEDTASVQPTTGDDENPYYAVGEVPTDSGSDGSNTTGLGDITEDGRNPYAVGEVTRDIIPNAPKNKANRILGKMYMFRDSQKIWTKYGWKCEHRKRKNKCLKCETTGCGCGLRKRCEKHSFATTNSGSMNMWDFEANRKAGVDPYVESPYSRKIGTFVCVRITCKQKCVHRWTASLMKFTAGDRCPFCSHHKVCACNSLHGLFPQVAAQLRSDEYNNEVDTTLISPKSNRKFIFVCEKTNCEKGCLHRIVSSPCNKIEYGCPYCSRSRCCPCNSVQGKFPHIAAQVMADAEGNHMELDKISPYSSKRFIFICDETNCERKCLHQWEASMSNRVNGSGCPFCSQTYKTVCECNSLSRKYPTQMKDWDYTKNTVDPKKLSPGSSIQCNWNCHVCHFEWRTQPKERTKFLGSGCPECALKRTSSKGERMIEQFLLERNIRFEREKREVGMKWKSQLRFDFKVEDKYAIEFDGQFHFRNATPYLREWKKTRHADIAKNEFCLRNHIPLLRISYTTMRNIPGIIQSFLDECSIFERVGPVDYEKKYGKPYLFVLSDSGIYEQLQKDNEAADAELSASK